MLRAVDDKELASCLTCKGLCTICKGTGQTSKSESGPSWDRGDGVIYGSASWSLEKCPHGCLNTTRVIL